MLLKLRSFTGLVCPMKATPRMSRFWRFFEGKKPINLGFTSKSCAETPQTQKGAELCWSAAELDTGLIHHGHPDLGNIPNNRLFSFVFNILSAASPIVPRAKNSRLTPRAELFSEHALQDGYLDAKPMPAVSFLGQAARAGRNGNIYGIISNLD